MILRVLLSETRAMASAAAITGVGGVAEAQKDYMSNHRRFQNIRVPIAMRPSPARTSVSRTVRNIQTTTDDRFTLVGTAVVYFREFYVATVSGKYWVIVGARNVKT